MSDCIHCDIHELLETRLQNQEVNLVEIVAKVTEVLADLILMAPSDEQSTLMADMLANLGGFCLRRKNPPNQLIRAVQAVSEPFFPIDHQLVLGANMVCVVHLDSAMWKLLLQFQTSFQCFNKNSICRSNFPVDFDNIGFTTQNIFFNNGFHKSPPRY
jgi:hypothetical protein